MLYRPGLLGRIPCPQDWYFGSGPPVFDDAFIGAIPAGYTFRRNSANATDCTYLDGATVTTFTTYSVDQPRFLPFGLLMEPQRSNYMLNSEAPTTGSKTLTLPVGYYTVWYLGTQASMTIGGLSATTVPAGGSATVGVPFSFQVTVAGTISISVLAGCLRVQCEDGPDATSYILCGPTNPAVRSADTLTRLFLGGQINYPSVTHWVEFMWAGNTGFPSTINARLLTASVAGAVNNFDADQIQLFRSGSTNSAATYSTNGSGTNTCVVTGTAPKSPGNVSRVATSVSPTRNQIAMDYALADGAANVTQYRPANIISLALCGGGAQAMSFNGYLRGYKFWPVAMPDSELKECTGVGYYHSGPLFDYDFTQMVLPRRWTFNRTAPTGTPTDSFYTDAPGSTFNSFPGTNTPRLTPNGLILEGVKSNFIGATPSAPVSGNTITMGAQQYCLWMIGTGSVTINAGTTGAAGLPQTATQGNPVWFTTTQSGNASITVTGSVNRVQIEQQGVPGTNPLPTTFINTAGGVRGVDCIFMSGGNWFPQNDVTYYMEVIAHSYFIASRAFGVGVSASDREMIFTNAPTLPGWNIGGNSFPAGSNQGRVDPPQNVTIGQVTKFAYSIGNGRRVAAQNGQVGVPNTNVVPRIITAGVTLYLGAAPGEFPNPSGMPLRYRRFRIYDFAMTDAQLQSVTT